MNDFQISKHFNLREFQSPDTGEVKVDSKLIEKLELLRQRFERPIIINSGYRTPEHNAKVGGSKNSLHVQGKAVDIKKVAGLTIDEMAKLAEEVGFDGIGKYNWGIHVDIRGYKARWDGR